MPDRILTFEESIMPRSTIKACAKTVLHADTAIQKDALTALAKSSSVFISYLTTHANEIALSKKRKIIMPSDVLDALKVIEFERFIPEMQELHDRAEAEALEKKERRKSNQKVIVPASTNESGEIIVHPPSKKARLDDEIESGMEGVIGDQSMQDSADDAEENELDVVDDEEDEEVEEPEEDEGEGEVEENEVVNGNRIDATLTTSADLDPDESQNRQRDDYDEALDDGDESD